jgi:adenine-specific DNA-methyltransferase
MSGALLSPNTAIQNPLGENDAYLTKQLITYMGNKRALLDFIGLGLRKVQKRLHKKRLTLFDGFSGSGIVARFFKQYAESLLVNDLEKYSTLINLCYLSNHDDLDSGALHAYYDRILQGVSQGELKKGIISALYAPGDEANIHQKDRVFYTVRNAMYIDTVRQLIEEIPQPYQKYFIAPLLSEASIHANTSGVFKGFYKNKETGIGQFGGTKQDALWRITGNITLPFPVFSNFNTHVQVYNGDTNALIHTIPEVDLAYLDPPYNQHPYGSNYFMLNVILDYAYPENTSAISGIPKNWNRSKYNKESYALSALTELVTGIKAKYVLLSFNSEGFMCHDEMKNMLHKIGNLEVLETTYNAFRGSRNLNNREIHVKEYLYLLEK